jgi:hypothetical protein
MRRRRRREEKARKKYKMWRDSEKVNGKMDFRVRTAAEPMRRK